LTPKRSKRVTENDEYLSFLQRVVRSYGRRIAAGDIDALPGLAAMAAELDAAMQHGVNGLRTAGYSWADIAARLGVTRQGAHQRWSIGARE
jgi:ribosomal protein S20